PTGKTGMVLRWTIEPNAIPGWVRKSNIGFSQVGYLPNQPKVSVIELDKNDQVEHTASIIRINTDGSTSTVFTADVALCGDNFKYQYSKFNFSALTSPTIHYSQYADVKTNLLLIDTAVNDDKTNATCDTWIPTH